MTTKSNPSHYYRYGEKFYKTFRGFRAAMLRMNSVAKDVVEDNGCLWWVDAKGNRLYIAGSKKVPWGQL